MVCLLMNVFIPIFLKRCLHFFDRGCIFTAFTIDIITCMPSDVCVHDVRARSLNKILVIPFIYILQSDIDVSSLDTCVPENQLNSFKISQGNRAN